MPNKRICGGCKECCYVYPVPELGKLDREWCRHCNEAGCAIHDQEREEVCEAFRCMWLKMPSTFPENLRPDRCGVIFASKGFLLVRATLRDIKGMAIWTGRVQAVIERLKRRGWIVGVGYKFEDEDGELVGAYRIFVDHRRYPAMTASAFQKMYTNQHRNRIKRIRAMYRDRR